MVFSTITLEFLTGNIISIHSIPYVNHEHFMLSKQFTVNNLHGLATRQLKGETHFKRVHTLFLECHEIHLPCFEPYIDGNYKNGNLCSFKFTKQRTIREVVWNKAGKEDDKQVNPYILIV